MRRISAVALVCAFTLGSNSALASSQASASLTGLNFQVIDLNPLDGAATFNYVGGATSLSLSTTDNAVGESDTFSRTRPGFLSFTKAFESDLTNVSGSASIGATGLQLAGSATGPGTSYSAAGSSGSGYYSNSATLTLSAHSMLIITATANVFASALNPQACPGSYYYYGCSPSETASASTSMQLSYSYSNSSGYVNYNYSDSLGVSAQGRGSFQEQIFAGYREVSYGGGWHYWEPVYNIVTHEKVAETKSLSKVLSAVFINTSDSNQTASLWLNANISGVATSPVPEPSTWLLGFAGLAAVFVARRRVF